MKKSQRIAEVPYIKLRNIAARFLWQIGIIADNTARLSMEEDGNFVIVQQG